MRKGLFRVGFPQSCFDYRRKWGIEESTKQNMLEALQEELLQAATEVDNNVIPIERSEEQ